MSCFKPNFVRCTYDDLYGTFNYTFGGPALGHVDISDLGSFDNLNGKNSFSVLVPCRHCLGCRIDYSRQWANRMCIELKDMKKAIFLTLTYSPENVPLTDRSVMTLNKRDTQLFMKRLRKHFSGVRIRFYLAGEYGPKNKRPHYHAIIYGLSLDDFPDKKIIGSNEIKDLYFTSPLLEKIWSKGYILLGDVSYKTCAYVSRYVLKKHYKFDVAHLRGAEPEFNVSSRRPGIGLLNYEETIDKGIDHISISTVDGVHTFPIPKAFVRKARDFESFVNDVYGEEILMDAYPSEFYSSVLSADENLSKRIDFCNDLVYNRVKESNDRLRTSLVQFDENLETYLREQEKALAQRIKLLPERS